jgi:hypothetical protein
MSLTKLPLGRNNSVMTSLFPHRESLVVTSRLGTGNSRTFFYGVGLNLRTNGNKMSASKVGEPIGNKRSDAEKDAKFLVSHRNWPETSKKYYSYFSYMFPH